MTTTKISLKQTAKLLGIRVSEAKRIHNSLIKKGYIKPLNKDGAFRLTVPDPKLASTIPYNPTKFTS
jgi:DNA-binding IclR family transcriptional regulator